MKKAGAKQDIEQDNTGKSRTRNPDGTFIKGISGNPKGNKKKSNGEKKKPKQEEPLIKKIEPRLEIIKKPKVKVPRNPDGTFIKGVSGNPNGKAKGFISITTLLKKALSENMLDKDGIDTGITYAEALTRRIMSLGINDGIPRIIDTILDRTEGKPKQPIEFPDLDEQQKLINKRVEELVSFGKRYENKD